MPRRLRGTMPKRRLRLTVMDMLPPAHRTWWSITFSTVGLPLAVAIGTAVGSTPLLASQPQARPLDAAAITLLAIGPVALLARRRHPPAVFAVAAAAVLGYFAAGYPFGGPGVFLPAIVALAATVIAGYRWAAYTITAVTFTALVVLHILGNGEGLLVGSASWLAWLATVIAGCELWRSRRQRLAQATAARGEAQRRQVSEERLRIARELHDVLGHHVSLINVQAGVALYLLDDDPQQARDALAAIKQSSGELLREMRSTLGVLRGIDEPPRHPAAGLARLGDLVADNQAAGLPVTVEVIGTRRDLPASIDLAAYRIVQEALTNTRRHAGQARAHVRLQYDESGLTVRVDDDGAGPPPHTGREHSGNGLPGMRERASAFGGSLTAGPRPEGGFRVHAQLPLSSVEAS